MKKIILSVAIVLGIATLSNLKANNEPHAHSHSEANVQSYVFSCSNCGMQVQRASYSMPSMSGCADRNSGGYHEWETTTLY